MKRVLVSACLLGEKCKYNGGDNYSTAVVRFLEDKEVLAICPEEAGGLPTPRPASEIYCGSGEDVLAGQSRVLTREGADVTTAFITGAKHAVCKARELNAEAALLKERSPSCGVRQIYDGSFSGTAGRGQGVTAAALAREGLELFSEEYLPWEGLAVDYGLVTEKIVSWLREKVAEAKCRGAVVGLSGGIDSAVTAALIKRAFGSECLAAIMPIESSSVDLEDAWAVARKLEIETTVIDLEAAYRSLVTAAEPGGLELGPDNLALANVKPRLRMTTLYYLAARNNYLVAGTGNKSELFTGFFTKYGDGGVDLEPIGDLVKIQVQELARHLGIPEQVISKTPSAGLWPGQTDEGELGFTYAQLDEYILTGATDPEAEPKIRDLNSKVQHKLTQPPICYL
ncbi:MAG: NAD(+) synthase [Firmicutes bacterium]|nr:NAD(+) synthase [Bacillota bacterium]